jgi:hypothetical protein
MRTPPLLINGFLNLSPLLLYLHKIARARGISAISMPDLACSSSWIASYRVGLSGGAEA